MATILYQLAIETGLRANELRCLLVGDFDFVNHTVTIRAKYEKNRKGMVLPLRSDTAELVKTCFSSKLASARAFKMPSERRLAEMLRVDLKAAGIADTDQDGRITDFHALRHTTGSVLAAMECCISTGNRNRLPNGYCRKFLVVQLAFFVDNGTSRIEHNRIISAMGGIANTKGTKAITALYDISRSNESGLENSIQERRGRDSNPR